MRFIPFLILAVLIISACCRPPELQPQGLYQNQLLICNEGIYTQTSGTVSGYNFDSQTATNNLFFLENGRELGNVLQSICTHRDKVYFIVNNAQKIEVADRNTLKEYAQIRGLQQPRYMLPLNDSLAYVSQWGANGLTGALLLVNLYQNQIMQTTPTFKGAEKMLLYQNQLWLCHSGGYDSDNRLAIINSQTQQIDTVIVVADNPHSLQIDQQARIWVACRGKAVYSNYPDVDTALSTAPALYCFEGKRLIHVVNFDKNSSLNHLDKDASGRFLFFCHNNQLLKFDTQNLTSQVIATGSFYGMNVINNELYAARSAGINPAQALRWTANGQLLDSFEVGIFANGFYQ